jgi:hypothetical protein
VVIQRYTRIRKSTPRSRAKTKVREKVRLAVFERSKGMCELKKRKDCLGGPLPYESHNGTPYDHGHLVHLKSEGSGGKTDMENCRWGCWMCHLLGLHRGEYSATDKPVPPKQSEFLTDRMDWTREYYGN